MNTRLSLALSAALAAGVACKSPSAAAPVPDPSPTPTMTQPGETTPETGTDAPVPAIETSAIPDLAETCQAPALEALTPGEPVDYLALRSVGNHRSDARQESAKVGEACKTASDAAECSRELAQAWPSGSGYGYCGMGCTDIGLVYTRGDTVAVVDSPDEAAKLLAPIDTVQDALHIVRTHNFEPECATTMAAEGGGYVLRANILVSDCPFTNEIHQVHVAPDGTFTKQEMIERKQSGGCAGRRPEGLMADAPVGDCTAVAAELTHLVHLEAAAVVAFERLARDLERLGAPDDLIARARASAGDEVRHTALASEAARRHGATDATIAEAARPVVCAHDPTRTVLALALENAIEGCVRETFGVVDALFRARSAATPELRAMYRAIARDETRHAELSWDLHRWFLGRLRSEQRLRVVEAMARAADTLRDELASGPDLEVQRVLGAPSAQAARSMVTTLTARLV